MASTSDRLHDVANDLRRQRDELKLKLHLLGAEARDEWTTLEKKLEHLEGKLKVIGREAGAVAQDVGDALELVGRELKAGYERLRKLL
jgi:hypothetical protein